MRVGSAPGGTLWSRVDSNDGAPGARAERDRVDPAAPRREQLDRSHRAHVGPGAGGPRDRRGRGSLDRGTAVRQRGQPAPPHRRRHDRHRRLAEDVLVERAAADPDGRDINGEICSCPDGGRLHRRRGHRAAESAAGLGRVRRRRHAGRQAHRDVQHHGAEPYGCAFAPDGTLFTSDVGFQGFGTANGQLILWFPPYTGSPGRPAPIRTPTRSRPTSASSRPTSAPREPSPSTRRAACTSSQSSGLRIDAVLAAVPDRHRTRPADAAASTRRARRSPTRSSAKTFIDRAATGVLTFSGLAFAPNGNLYAASVFTGRIGEYDLDGNLVRLLLGRRRRRAADPDRSPQGIAVGADGTVYYADLDLVRHVAQRRTRPERQGVAHPLRRRRGPRAAGDRARRARLPRRRRDLPRRPRGDAAAGPLEWPTSPADPSGSSSTPTRTTLTAATAPKLIERWRFRTGRGRHRVADGGDGRTCRPRGRTRVVFFTSWDGNLYALDWATARSSGASR